MSSIFDRFELASIARMINNARSVHERSGKPTLLILLDMAKCILRDHVGYMEYNLFNFVSKNQSQRDTYVNFDYSQNLFRTLNDPEYSRLFNDKLEFNRIFSQYLGREYLDISQSTFEDFERFCKGKKKIFSKPADSFPVRVSTVIMRSMKIPIFMNCMISLRSIICLWKIQSFSMKK